MRGHDEVKIKTHTDCRKVWDLLTSDKLKASQFAEDGGSIISRVTELERKTKIKFEHTHVETKNGNDDGIINKGLTMVSECDQKAKEERIKCVRENRSDNAFCVGNVIM